MLVKIWDKQKGYQLVERKLNYKAVAKFNPLPADTILAEATHVEMPRIEWKPSTDPHVDSSVPTNLAPHRTIDEDFVFCALIAVSCPMDVTCVPAQLPPKINKPSPI